MIRCSTPDRGVGLWGWELWVGGWMETIAPDDDDDDDDDDGDDDD